MSVAKASKMAAVPLPPGYVTVRDALDAVPPMGSLVNVVGVVCDFRAPIPTRNTDWKAQIQLYDMSMQDDTEAALQINIFAPQDQMPMPSYGDVMVIKQAKLQSYRSDMPSLLTNRNTHIYLYCAKGMPKPPGDPAQALIPNKTGSRPTLKDQEHAFISYLHYNVDKDRLPEDIEFDQRVTVSVNTPQKFQLLRDAQDRNFYDFVVEVVRPPYDMGDKFTLWVTDYTENNHFFNHAFTGEPRNVGLKSDDPYGYGTKPTMAQDSSSGWPGPYGKRSLQISCWDQHAALLRELNLTGGTWVMLSNVQMGYGANKQNLEGYMRGERGQFASTHRSRMRITKLDPTVDPENVDPRLKDAIRRKKSYYKLKKQQLGEIDAAAKAGEKRRAGLLSNSETHTPTDNSRKRRKTGRAKQRTKEKIERANIEVPVEAEVEIPITNLNTQVKCENGSKRSSPVAEILKHHHATTEIDGKTVRLELPFHNLIYRANLRVVDFAPSNLAHFSRVKKQKQSEYACLSDNSDISESEPDSSGDEAINPHGNHSWEWHFSLRLEDASADSNKKEKFWALVDNPSAQYLLNLDASNLQQDGDALTALQDKLSTLWGNLAEHKARRAARPRRDGPPADSSDEENNAPADEVANWPFPCCIRQYGVRVPERDPGKANAGKGQAWKRTYGIFGTRIVDGI